MKILFKWNEKVSSFLELLGAISNKLGTRVGKLKWFTIKVKMFERDISKGMSEGAFEADLYEVLCTQNFLQFKVKYYAPKIFSNFEFERIFDTFYVDVQKLSTSRIW